MTRSKAIDVGCTYDLQPFAPLLFPYRHTSAAAFGSDNSNHSTLPDYLPTTANFAAGDLSQFARGFEGIVENLRTFASEAALSSANCADTRLVDISRLVDHAVLVPRLRADTKIGAIKELVDQLYHEGAVADSLRFLQAVLTREDLQSTVIGEGVALPHARSTAVTRLGIAVGLAPEQISYPSADDGHDVQTIVLVAVPADAADSYLSLLGALAAALDSDAVVKHLSNATTSNDIIKVFSSASILPPKSPTERLTTDGLCDSRGSQRRG